MVSEEILLELITAKDKRLNIRISNRYHNRLHKLKQRTGVGISEMVRRGLVMYIEKHDF